MRRGRLPARLFRTCAALVALGGCSALPTRELMVSHEVARSATHREVPPPSTSGFAPANATAAQRADTLDRIWKVIEDAYFDPTFATIDLPALEARSRAELVDVRSDADFYAVLQRDVGELHDSHTQILTPEQGEYEHTQRTRLMGLGYRIVEGRVVIDSVIPGFPADQAGVKPGMLMEAVDDLPLDATFLDGAATIAKTATIPADPQTSREIAQLGAVSDLLSTTDDGLAEHRLTLRRADDSLWQVTLHPADGDLPTDEHLVQRPSGVAVLRLSRFDPSVVPALERDIDAATTSSRALIIDLRANPGGELDTAQRVLERFIDRREVIGSIVWRVWHFRVPFDIVGDPGPRPYLKPVAVLIDGSTASAAELTAHALVVVRAALVVGEPSCGCVVGLADEYLLPDGGVLRVAEADFRSAAGQRMEDKPLVPDIAITPTLAERRANVDAALEAAERALVGR
jgi:carboxyl-terminal processing protease